MKLRMNIAFFLTPKKDVTFLKNTNSVKRALELIDTRHFTAMPVIDPECGYWGTLTEGDLLRALRDTEDREELMRKKISELSLHTVNKPVRISCNIEDLILVAVTQNFVPVIDDNNKFIGIIKRSDIINYCYQRMFQESQKEA